MHANACDDAIVKRDNQQLNGQFAHSFHGN